MAYIEPSARPPHQTP